MASAAQLRRSLAPYEEFPLQELLARAVSRHGQKTAVIDGDQTYSYAQLGECSDRLASALAGLGVGAGDRVAILAPNCVEFVIAFYSIVKVGAIVTTVNSGYREREIAHQLNDSGAETLIVHVRTRGFMSSKPVLGFGGPLTGLDMQPVCSSSSNTWPWSLMQ